MAMMKKNFFCVQYEIFWLQEMKMFAVLSQSPVLKDIESLDCISGRINSATDCIFGFCILQLYIWFSECPYSVTHQLGVKMWLPLLAEDKVALNSKNSLKILVLEMGLTLQCTAQIFILQTLGLGALYISQCI